jgi:hypothetical protein
MSFVWLADNAIHKLTSPVAGTPKPKESEDPTDADTGSPGTLKIANDNLGGAPASFPGVSKRTETRSLLACCKSYIRAKTSPVWWVP